MYELAWTTLGIAIAFVAMRLWPTRGTSASAHLAGGDGGQSRNDQPGGARASVPATTATADERTHTDEAAADRSAVARAHSGRADSGRSGSGRSGVAPHQVGADDVGSAHTKDNNGPGHAPPAATVAADSLPISASAPPQSPRATAIALESRRMALSLAEELANLASGVEGRAHHLIEAAPTRSQLPSAAEAMLNAVRRLRTLHTKLVALGHGRPIEQGTSDLSELIAGLGDELQQMQLGLELHWEPPPDLPHVAASPAAMRDAMLFLCAALLRAERGATRLSFVAERSFSRQRPTIKIELTLEWITAPRVADPAAPNANAFALDLEAAEHLIVSHGGELTMSHLPGKSVSAVARLPVVTQLDEAGAPVWGGLDDEVDEWEPAPDFGGALLLESDPALRAVLARELKASGRAVFACADGVSAHTFLEATPERFELLLVDDLEQLAQHTDLAKTIRSRAPQLKICLLTPTPGGSPPDWPTLHCLQKPFGVHELRRKLASILTAG